MRFVGYVRIADEMSKSRVQKRYKMTNTDASAVTVAPTPHQPVGDAAQVSFLLAGVSLSTTI